MNESQIIKLPPTEEIIKAVEETKRFRAVEKIEEQEVDLDSKEEPQIEPFALPLVDFMAGSSDVSWLWDGILAKPSLGILAAKPKFGKTLLTFNLAIAVNQGGDYLGRTVEKTNVLIIQLEDPPVIIRNRLHKMNANGDGLFIRAGLPMNKEDWKTLAEFIAEKEIGLIIVDPFIFAMRGNEQDATATGIFLREIRELIFSTNCSVLLVHHHRKSGGEHGDAIRGSSAILGAVDVALELIREDEDDPTATLKITSRFAQVEPEIILLDVETLTWKGQGSAKDYKASKREGEIIEALTDRGEMDIPALEDYLGISIRRFRDGLKKLVADGLVNEQKAPSESKGAKPFLYSLKAKNGELMAQGCADNSNTAELGKDPKNELTAQNPTLGVEKNAVNLDEPELWEDII